MSIIIGGGSGGIGGAGFSLGPQQNVFTGATRVAAESARDTYANANPDWLAQYNADTSLNIRLEFTEGGEEKVVYQTRNQAGDAWLDNQSFEAIKGDKGDDGAKGDDGVVQEIVAGSNVTVDSSNPARPIVSSTGGGGFDPSGLSPNTVPVVNNTSTDLIDSSITETDTNIVMTKTLIVPQESLQVGPALTVSDKGGNLGLANKAEGYDSFVAVNRIYETEAERDKIFPDSVPKIKYEYLVPAKWVYQFPFDSETSDDNYLSFELSDTDNTYVRKIRLFSESARTGVRIWIENLLPTGDQLVWENVSEKDFNDGKGDDLNSSGFSEIEIGLIKISTANIPFRFNIQAQAGEKLNIRGTKADIGFGEGFYPKLFTYTQDSLDVEALDAVDTSAHRFGDFDPEFRIDSKKVVVRDKGRDQDVTAQGVFDTPITSDRPVVEYVNGSSPVCIRGIKVKHTGTWSPVQVSFNDLRTTSTSLVDGDNTIQIDGNPLTLEANETLKVTFTGAVGTGSQTQISLLGDSSQKPYAVLETTAVTVKGVGQVDSVVAGSKISVDNTDPENPVINWSPDRDETVSNFAGIFENTAALVSKYPSPPDGLYANVLQGNGDLPDDRYESNNGQWIGQGGIAGRVIVDNVKSLGIVTGEGLKYEDEGGNAKISLSGRSDIIDLDMSLDSTRTLDATYVGKIANLVQSLDISVVGQISITDHSDFSTGDVITITASETYTNYYFAVYYNNASGRQRVSYPSNKITLTRTDTDWDVSLDGRFTNVLLSPPSQTSFSGNPIADNTRPVSGLVFVERAGVEFVEDDSGRQLVKVDVGVHDLINTELKYIDLDSSYHDLNNTAWGTVIADNVPNQDIAYFYMVGKGSSFTNLPSSLALIADADYSIATEVTKGEDGGFAQRLSIVSPTDADANNRTIQRAGLNFEAGKQAWSEVMLKRDAVVFQSSVAETPDEVFSAISVGDNMTGEVVDGTLQLNANSEDPNFDVVTTRVLNVHEGPDNADKFTRWAVDGNFNTEVHAVGDTHYYAKNKVTDDLTEAYQVYEDGKVEFKNGVEFTNDTLIDHEQDYGLVLQGDSIYGKDKDGYEHFFVERNNFNVKSKVIQNVRDGVAHDDAVNVSQLSELEAKVTTLTQLVVQQAEHIHSLEESNGIAFGDFDIFSSQPNEVRVDMYKLNGDTVSKTIQLGNAPPHVDPTPPDPQDFNVYYGWDINSRALIQPDDIINYEGTDERSATLDMQADNLLTTEFSLTRSDNSIYKYMYVAYPKDVVDPNPYRVEYSGFVADWLRREVTIDNMVYIVLITEYPNIAESFTIKLHN